jgi:hypothetical protein
LIEKANESDKIEKAKKELDKLHELIIKEKKESILKMMTDLSINDLLKLESDNIYQQWLK